jgi:hypothetical protein
MIARGLDPQATHHRDFPSGSRNAWREPEHIPLESIRFERQEYAPAFESGAISCRPGDSTRWTSALGMKARVLWKLFEWGASTRRAAGRAPWVIRQHETAPSRLAFQRVSVIKRGFEPPGSRAAAAVLVLLQTRSKQAKSKQAKHRLLHNDEKDAVQPRRRAKCPS